MPPDAPPLSQYLPYWNEVYVALSLLLWPTFQQRSIVVPFYQIQKMLSARFASLNITRKMYCASFHIVRIPFTQTALTNGCSNTQHAQYVEFHCASFLRKSICNQCPAHLSALIAQWNPSIQITIITICCTRPQFRRERMITLGWSPSNRISLQLRAMEWKLETRSASQLRVVRVQKNLEINTWRVHLIGKYFFWCLDCYKIERVGA